MTGMLSGQAAIVTGAAQGIGAAIAQALAAEGARVALLDRDADKAQQTAIALQGAVGLGCDVADRDAVNAAVDAAETAHGPTDILVCNAGISPKPRGRKSPLWEMPAEEWDAVVGVNFTGAWNLMRAITPGMVDRRRGRIVLMSSVAGKVFLDLVGCHYHATKAGLIGLTRAAAGELGPYNITVNAIAPGRINTDLVRAVGEETNRPFIQQTPLGRLGEPAEVADLALWFASPQAGFITGQTVDVAGGWLMT